MSEESGKPGGAEAQAEESPSSDSGGGCQGDEFVIPGPPLPGGARMCLHHGTDHTVRTGVMKPMEDGKPIEEDAILLEQREGTGLYNVVGSVSDLKKGPSKVNSPAFRDGWDRIFGKPATVGKA
jgi:hypothetical protein